jgi:hypothetical protein
MVRSPAPSPARSLRRDCSAELCAGLLYAPGQYDEAVAAIQSLLQDRKRADAIAQQGREEVERWGWSAATRVLRREQYARAIRNKHAHRRFGVHALRRALLFLLRLPFAAVAALFSFLVALLDNAASPFRARTV